MKIDICIECKRKIKIKARGLCNNCYMKWIFKNNPEYYEKQKERYRKWQKSNKDKHNKRNREWSKKYRENNRDEWNKKRREHYHRNTEYKLRRERIRLKRVFNISDEELNKILEQTKCYICGDINNLMIDHNHKTGKVRARLCMRCNFGIEFLERSEWVNKAFEYLNKFN
jgi:hypothetical protein